MQGVTCRLTARDTHQRRRSLCLPVGSIEGRLKDQYLGRSIDGNIGVELVGLLPGEYISLHNGFHFRVLRGSVELNGHIYTPQYKSFKKVLIPPWVPPERMLALCQGSHELGKAGSPQKHQRRHGCSSCKRLLEQQFMGGSCCDLRRRLENDDVLVKRHFNIAKPRNCHDDTCSDSDKEAISFYDREGPLQDSNSTLVAFIMHKSAFGLIRIKHIFAFGRKPKIITPQLTHVASKLLEICASGEKPPVLIVHGDKSSGKSTSVIYIINYLLNHVSTVALLDTDVGQPIFGAPATVSLKFVTEPITTPTYSLLAENKPEVTLLIGDVKVSNPVLTMGHINRCVEIYRKCVEDDRSIPLIVNTFGWTTGMGAKILDSVATITTASLMLRLNSKHLNGVTLPTATNHEELENAILEKTTIENETDAEQKTEVMPIYETIMEAQGLKPMWDRSNCSIIDMLSHSQITTLINGLMEQLKVNYADERKCSLKTWMPFQRKRSIPEPSPGDLRWLRTCAMLIPSFADAMHFPQLQQEEFFGNLGGPEFRDFVANPELFMPPKQLLLGVERLSFVLQVHHEVDKINEICPVIAGSIVALCNGHCEQQITTRYSAGWEFLAFVYVHYLNLEDMTLLISHSVSENAEELAKASIVVLCQSVGFDTIPTRLCNILQYPVVLNGKSALDMQRRPREMSTSQFVPFRRNTLLHMINVQGAGNSAGGSRKSIKRHKQDVK